MLELVSVDDGLASLADRTVLSELGGDTKSEAKVDGGDLETALIDKILGQRMKGKDCIVAEVALVELEYVVYEDLTGARKVAL